MTEKGHKQMPRSALFPNHSTQYIALLMLLSSTALAQKRPGATNTTATVATPAPATECVPSCSVGYVCARGKCVSVCNPPCAAHEVCTAARECVAVAPAPTASPAYAPAAGQPILLAPVASPGVETKPAFSQSSPTPPVDEPPAEVRTLTFVPRLGAQFVGFGTLSSKCDGASCEQTGFSSDISRDYNMGLGVAVGADLMFKLVDLFRIGPGVMHTFSTGVSTAGKDVDAGSITEFNFIAEAIPRVSPTVWLVPRLHGGLALFTTTGEASTATGNLKAACNEDKSALSSSGVNVNCSNFDNPHIGFDLGLGFGGMYAVSSAVRLRADLMYEYFHFALGKEAASGGNITLTRTLGMSGSRFLLMGGLEF